jgi:hypothetical protein
MASSVAPARSMLVAAEWRRRRAPREGASVIPARLSPHRTMPATLLNGRKGANVRKKIRS